MRRLLIFLAFLCGPLAVVPFALAQGANAPPVKDWQGMTALPALNAPPRPAAARLGFSSPTSHRADDMATGSKVALALLGMGLVGGGVLLLRGRAAVAQVGPGSGQEGQPAWPTQGVKR